MNWLDLLILLILSLNVFLGFKRGLIRSVFGLAAFLLSIFIASLGTPFLASLLAGYLVQGMVANILAFILLFFLGFFSISIIGSLLHDSFKKSFLMPVNFFGGGLFGLFKGIIIVVFLLVPALQNPLLSPVVTNTLLESQLIAVGEPLISSLSPGIEFVIEKTSRTWEDKKELGFQGSSLDNSWDNSWGNSLKPKTLKVTF
jgi:membrane protein required for colicin V production